METFIKCMRGADTLELSKRPNELTLFFNIAIKAKRSERFSAEGLEIGETLVKGCRECGLSGRSYRTAKANLEKWGFVTSRPTNRGMVFKIMNSEHADEQGDKLPTSKRRATDEQPTSTIYTRRKECKNEKKKIPFPHDFKLDDSLTEYAKGKGINGNLKDVFEDFSLYHQKKGSRFVDWGAAWKSWIRKHLEFHPPARPIEKIDLEDLRSND